MNKNKNFTDILKQAQTYHQEKDYKNEIKCLKKIILLKPDYYDGLLLLGINLSLIKEYYNAAEYFVKAIDLRPDCYEGYKHLGKTLYLSKRELDTAIMCLKKAISLNPDDKTSYFYLAEIYISKNDHNSAISILSVILILKPDDPDILFLLSQIYIKLNLFGQALHLLDKITEIKPDHINAHFEKGNILAFFGDCGKATDCYKKVLEINPLHKSAQHRLGISYSRDNHFEEGMEAFKKALDLGCDEIEIYGDMAATLLYNNFIDKAIEYYEKIIDKDPENARILCAYGQTFLVKGDFDKGLKYYEYRLLKKDARVKKEIYSKISTPHWEGEPLDGKTIYTYYEQGFGDTVQFARFIPDLVSMGANVIFKPQNAFYDLFLENNLGATIINPDIPDDEIEFDAHIPLMSLPYYLKTQVGNIPLSEGYIKANPDKVKEYKEKYFDNSMFKIGIAWQGGKFGFTNRNMPFEKFLDIAKIPNVKLYSFQKDDRGDQINQKLDDMLNENNIVNLGKTFNDFSDTAAAIENLDLVVMSDNSIIHVAGALSKQTWLLLPYGSEWRWLLNRDDSPWYKSFKLFRQVEINNWDHVFENVIKELHK